MPIGGLVPADDVSDDPKPDFTLNLNQTRDVQMTDYNSAENDNLLLPPVLTRESTAATGKEKSPVSNLRVILDNSPAAQALVSAFDSSQRDPGQLTNQPGEGASRTAVISPSLSTRFSEK